MTAPIRVAVIGAGVIGRKHIAKIDEHPDFVLAGIAEINRDATAAAYPNVLVQAEVGSMLDAARPDAVIIASPNQLHEPHALECAGRGIPFILEKPVADTIEAAARICAAARKSGVPTLVGHHRRHHPPIAAMRRLLRDGAIGQVVGVSGVWATCKPDPYFEAGGWRKEKGGGPVLINLIHEIDCLRFCLGEVISISALTSNRQRGFVVEDTAAVTIGFESGAIGTFLMSDTAVSPWTMEQALGEVPEFPFSGQSGYRFLGTLGSLEAPALRLWKQGGDPRSWHHPVLAQELDGGKADPYIAQLSHFRDLIRGEAQSIQPVADGARTLVATLAVREASERGVSIDLRDRYRPFEADAA
ncbi:MAG: Gfo/Idh/MocA family protein [Beijerinckiaceae bacterium]